MAGSVVALIGTSAYEAQSSPADQLDDIPQVAANIHRLQQTLPSMLRVSSIEVRTLQEPENSDEIASFVADAAERASDLLLIYYAGHGLLNASGDLTLSNARSRASSGDYRTLDFDVIRRACLASPASMRVVILDCCYSGAATRKLLGSSNMNAQFSISKSYVLASSPATKPSHMLQGEKYTAFTGRLFLALDRLLESVESTSLNEIVPVLKSLLKADGLPLPEVADRNGLGDEKVFHRSAITRTTERDTSTAPSADTSSFATNSKLTFVTLYGLTGIYMDLNEEDNRAIAVRIRCASDIFFVAHTGYNALVSQYQNAIKQSIQKGGRLRVVVTDPHSPLMQQEELTKRLCPSIQQSEEIRLVLQSCARHQRTALSAGQDVRNVQARLYRGTPSVNILLIDGWMRMIPYLPLIDASESPVYEFDFAAPNGLANKYKYMLENLWGNSRAVDLDAYEQ
jgi:hypothetical protein